MLFSDNYTEQMYTQYTQAGDIYRVQYMQEP